MWLESMETYNTHMHIQGGLTEMLDDKQSRFLETQLSIHSLKAVGKFVYTTKSTMSLKRQQPNEK